MSNERIKAQRAALLEKVDEIRSAFPSVEIIESEYGFKYGHYDVWFNREVRTERKNSIIYNSTGLVTKIDKLKKQYLTKEDAVNAITAILPKARAKFNEIAATLKELKETHDFDISYMLYGDTHGIEDDYLYISFSMDGFSFSFELEE